ncbi:hypothetical protein CTA1_6742 [Colletotrichum tanaceti]|uniref:Uncharacterized protein n=1 Tax=Colletotrichum tanaceti TaxID=1306861 RepID=A0A4U6WZ94_9PEZI|nr:hypothetical protein CTA1_6742 [Colletotrichum tanaceti]
MSLHNGAYSHQGYSAPPYSQGYHHPPGGQMYAAHGHSNTQIYYTPDSNSNNVAANDAASSSASSARRHWYGQPGRPRSECSPPAADADDNLARKRRRLTYMYYVLRQIAIIAPLVVMFLNINIYVSRRGRYLNDSTSPADPIFYTMWLTVPIVSASSII